MLYPSLNLQSPVLDPNLSRGLVGYWPLDDQGGIAYDRSGSGNHGTLVGDTKSVISERGRVMSFDGAGDYVDIGGSTVIGTGDYSISLWARYNPPGTYHALFGVYADAATAGTIIFGDSAGLQFRISSGVGGSVNCNFGDKDDNQWHHFVASADRDGNGSTYTDGILVDSQNISSQSAYSLLISAMFIGIRWAAGGWDFNGSIDEVMIFNRALSLSEAKQLHLYGMFKRRDPIELWTAATSGTIIPLIQYYNQQARA